MEQTVRRAIARSGNLDADASSIGLGESLYDLGLKSFSCVQLLFTLEEDFGIEIPDELMKRETFQSINSIIAALQDFTPVQTPS